MNSNYKTNGFELHRLYEDKNCIENEIRIHKENYCNRGDCYSEYNYVTFRQYVCSANSIYMHLDALIYNSNLRLNNHLTVSDSEIADLNEILRWTELAMTDMKIELTDSLNKIVTSGHNLSSEDESILNATELYSAIR